MRAGDDENVIQRVRLSRPIEVQKLQIRIRKQTSNGSCYLRIGYDGYQLKELQLGNRHLSAEKLQNLMYFITMRNQPCEQCKNPIRGDTYCSFCKDCNRKLCASCTLLRLAGDSNTIKIKRSAAKEPSIR